MYFLDAHCDTITSVMRKNQELYDNPGHISLKKLEAFNAPVIFFAIYFNKDKVDNLFQRYLQAYDFLEAQIAKNSSIAAMGRSFDEIDRNFKAGKLSAVPAIEEGGILEGKMDNFYKAADMGVRYITLTWNYPNEIGEPSAKKGGGLTPFGKDLLKEMNARDVFADVSHLSEAGFWDVYKLSTKPFIASHSNAKTLLDHHRNLTDDQLKAIGEKGGCVGVNFCNDFLVDGSGPQSTIDDLCRHVDHILKLAGEEAVGLGTDYDGISRCPAGLEDASKLPDLYKIFAKRYGAELAEKMFFWNFMRLLKG